MESATMPSQDIEIRAAKLVDLPLISRLVEKGTPLDSEQWCTREVVGSQSALLSSIPLPQRELFTLVGRVGRQSVVGQYRMRGYDHLAQMIYVAPQLEPDVTDTPWLHLIDAITSEAGKRGATILSAEVGEDSPLFVTMRTAGFAVYARQQLWMRLPGKGMPAGIVPAVLTEETEADAGEIQLLYSNIVPRLVQPVVGPPPDCRGFVYRGPTNRPDRPDGCVQGYVAVSEGKSGIYILPFLHPDVLFSEASAIIAGAIARVSRADRLPVYVCVRRYQDWLEETLIDLGFEPGKPQAVMVRHIAAGVRHAVFAPLSQTLEMIPSPIRPPTSRIDKLEV
jgi:hypothetical protein